MTHSAPAADRDLTVAALARVEGEGAMHVRVVNGRVAEVQLNIYEPPRFFEALLRGRGHGEPVDITARICGICPVAYQLSACAALEAACGVTVDEPLHDLRRLLYCGEWIQSHVLHMFFLHAPDFMGCHSAIELARDHRDIVERALQLRRIGNELITVVGGRDSHPVNVRLGGFYRTPTRREVAALRGGLERGLQAAIDTVTWVAGFDYPELVGSWELVALRATDEYPLHRGRLVSSAGLDVDIACFPDHVVERQQEHSTALHAHLRDGGTYLVGPLARYALAGDLLTPIARGAARAAGLGEVERNPFRSIVVRAVETVFAFEEALRLVDGYVEPDRPHVDVPPQEATGHGATEAPRGTLYHRYSLGRDGTIRSATIVPPTAQNQAAVEADLAAFVQANLDLPDDELRARCEQVIRNYDPCISCATHFLDLTVDRGGDGGTCG
jgi:sulfhydrogenase subunit alpha